MSNVGLLKVSGVCAILTAATLLVGLILLLGPVDYPDTDDIGTILLALDNDRVAYLTARWFILFGLVLAMASSLGFYYVLREAGGLLSIAIIGFITGTVFVMIQSFIELAIAYELVPAYVDATAATRPALEVMGNTLHVTGVLSVVVGNVLSFGIGVALFALATLRTSAIPKWLGWLGLLVAVLGGWLGLLAPVSGAFQIVSTIGSVAFSAWMVLMGIALLRSREVDAPAVGG